MPPWFMPPWPPPPIPLVLAIPLVLPVPLDEEPDVVVTSSEQAANTRLPAKTSAAKNNEGVRIALSPKGLPLYTHHESIGHEKEGPRN